MSAKTKKPANKKLPLKKKTANGYQFPEPVPKGEILTDLGKRRWKVGSSIGKGGFGEIYSASEEGKHSAESYVVKIEPHENGPLFVEMHFYMKNCKADDVEKWMKSKKLNFLGLPRYVASGSHFINNKKHRFLVMERFGKDLWTLFLENKKVFPLSTVLKLGLQILDVLEYIHSKGYVHADVKASNMLQGAKKGSEGQVYLVDFGLATRFSKDFKPDPKSAHNGTIEYTSRDAHEGVSTQRGDLEILAFNMLHWLCSRLPWEDKISNCNAVHQEKVKYMNDLPGLMKKCFPKGGAPDALNKYFKYATSLACNKEPDYELCRRIFKDGLRSCGSTLDGKLQFSQLPSKTSSLQLPKGSPARRGKMVTTSTEDDEDLIPESPPKQKIPKSARKVRPLTPFSKCRTDDDDSSKVTVPGSRAVRRRVGVPNGRQIELNSSVEDDKNDESDDDFIPNRSTKRGSDGFKESKGKKVKKNA